MNTKIQFVTAIHGNEPMPTLALAAMGQSQIIGNPRALSKGIRYTEQDLNASFGTEGNSYEEERARQLVKTISQDAKVVDMHTFSVNSEPFAIVVDTAYLPLACTLGVSKVVYMKHNIKAGHALINVCPGVSVEVGEHTDPHSFTFAQEIVQNVERGNIYTIKVYEVYGRITEKDEYINFEEKNGLIPILYGERAYDGLGFFGLAAREITSTIKQSEEI